MTERDNRRRKVEGEKETTQLSLFFSWLTSYSYVLSTLPYIVHTCIHLIQRLCRRSLEVSQQDIHYWFNLSSAIRLSYHLFRFYPRSTMTLIINILRLLVCISAPHLVAILTFAFILKFRVSVSHSCVALALDLNHYLKSDIFKIKSTLKSVVC